MKTPVRLSLQILVVLLLLGAGGGAVYYFVGRPQPSPEEPPPARGALVETRTVRRKVHEIKIPVFGTVEAARKVMLRPQVSGKIVKVHPDLRPGRAVKADEILVEIEKDDYEFAVEQAEARLSQARAEAKLEKGRAEVAREEWRYFLERGNEEEAGDRSLALRKPQAAVAEARMKEASARLDQARLNLERTVVRAPFNVIIQSEDAAIGKLVDPATPLAELIGSDEVRVEASVPLRLRSALASPDGAEEDGSAATVRLKSGAGTASWSGRVREFKPMLEPQGRMARLVIEVSNPFKTGKENAIPLSLNAFVEVEIDATKSEELVAVPREAVHRGDQVYLFDQGKQELRLRLTSVGRSLGLDLAQLTAQLRGSYFGIESFRRQRGRDELRVYVRLPEEERSTLASFEKFIVQTAGGEIPLGEAAEISWGEAPTKIERKPKKIKVAWKSIHVSSWKYGPDERMRWHPFVELIERVVFTVIESQIIVVKRNDGPAKVIGPYLRQLRED